MRLSDLPEIQIVRNVRSTRLRLRVDSQQIRLTAPVLCSKRQIQSFIDQSETWLIQTWQKQQEYLIQNKQLQLLPTELKLFDRAIPLTVSYHSQKQNFIFDDGNSALWVSDRQSEAYLKAFVNAYAKASLLPYLDIVSGECGLSFGKCSVRQPKTRWGSCTAKHDIMLNSALVLCPQEITRYVCVHELAHTKHFDHSALFWAKVAQYDPNYKNHRKALKSTVMPFWWNS